MGNLAHHVDNEPAIMAKAPQGPVRTLVIDMDSPLASRYEIEKVGI